MKKIFYILIILLIVSCTPTSKQTQTVEILDLPQITFTEKEELNEMMREMFGFGYTSDEKNIYLINGGIFVSPGFVTEISKYNINDDKWELLRTDLLPKRYLSSEYVNGKIYVFNGQLPNRFMNKTVEIFDTETDELTYGKRNPNPVMHSGSAVWGTKIYIFGGTVNDEVYSKILYSYDTETNEWSKLADMPDAIARKGIVVDGILYTFGGYKGTVSNSIDAYDIENDIWKHVGELPFDISAYAIASHGKNIWLIGSYDDLKMVAVYNTETNTTQQLQSNMWQRRHCGAEVVNEKLYIFGGNEDKFGPATNSIQMVNLLGLDSTFKE